MEKRKPFKQPVVAENTIEELSRKLIIANEDLQKSERERKEMLENISHDLRAPLTAIRSTIDYIKQKNSGKKQRLSIEEMNSMLDILDVRVRTLEVLVQDLYFLTRVESGQSEYDYSIVPLGQFLEEYFFLAEMDEKYMDYNLKLSVPNDMVATVRIDVAKMSRVLDNLFTNARKYSESGSDIILGAKKNDKTVCFYVKDNGRGIPESALSRVFDRTYRVSDSRTPEKEAGSGLGLPIAKTIVEQHGGSISCDSIEHEGSCFTVELPLLCL